MSNGRDQPSLRIAVIGGSLGGLTAALLLRDLGFEVAVYERSASELFGFGAGIVVHDATIRYFRERASTPVDQLSVGSRFLRYLARDGSVLHEEACSHRFTSWSVLYRHLLGLLGEKHYHRGQAFADLSQDSRGVQIVFADGRRERCDVLVCADGIMSTARRLLVPEIEPRYAGYVGWRGTVTEAELSALSADKLRDAITYSVVDSSHILGYPIPGPDGTIDEGVRLINFVWYRNLPEGPELEELMTDRHGELRAVSLHPGDVRETYVQELRHAAASLPRPLREMVTRTERPFVQVVVDLEVPQMAFGRVCLIGDAAFAARPHAAAGTAKAAENAWKLAEAFAQAEGDPDAALALWEPGQIDLGRNLVARSRAMGARYQFDGTWRPDDPDLRFGLYGPGR
jgi:2,6-dihydroxypyridine 3-monooxygenase